MPVKSWNGWLGLMNWPGSAALPAAGCTFRGTLPSPYSVNKLAAFIGIREDFAAKSSMERI